MVWLYFVSNFYEPISKAHPHKGYDALAILEKEKFGSANFATITMNVDGFHQASGADTDRVFEVHGTVRKFRCISCSSPIDIQDVIAVKNAPPRCTCGGYPRPAVTLFTEALPQKEWIGANRAIRELGSKDVVLIIGTSSVVYPAASLPGAAKHRGATLIEINPDETTPLSSLVDIHLRGGAAAVLPELVALVLQQDESLAAGAGGGAGSYSPNGVSRADVAEGSPDAMMTDTSKLTQVENENEG